MDESSELRSWHCTLCSNSITEFPLPAGESTRTSLELSSVEVVTDVMEADRSCALSGDEVSPSESFNVSGSFEIPQQPEEGSLQDPPIPPIPDVGQDQDVQYWIVPAGTQRGKPILVDNRGYSYTKWWQRNPDSSKSTWVCSIRGKSQRCPVSIIQRGDNFTPGSHTIHQLTPVRLQQSRLLLK